MEKEKIVNNILKLKKEKNAIILAHYYQIPEIQDIADFIGDSLGLSQQAKKTNADVIVFCGVHFMAETAKILSPEKRVFIPDMEAGCSLVSLCPTEDFIKFRNKYPDHKVITYINCSSEIKAVSDVICTSSNAVGIVESFAKNEKLIFAPDKNLGSYINSITGREMLLWDATCEVHDILKVERVIKLKNEYPNAQLIAHPECKAHILELADYIGSTTALLNYTISNQGKEFIVATETGIIHQMQKYSPDKKFIVVPSEENCLCNDCPYMKMNTLEKISNCLEYEVNEILINEDLIIKARKPIEKMLEISKKLGF
ncbi:MAG: quinolinate synthase NadA [Bacteroidetes bacterium]|nr:quinolinate synthase NadA [Bacteroidota bacterium]